MQLLTASKVTTADLGTFFNLAMRETLESHQWSARKAETVVNTVAPYDDGTVSIAAAGTTVTGTGTTFTSAMVNRFIRINDEPVFYKITAFSSTTSITIEKAWPFAAATAVAYEIFQYLYTVDATAGEVGTLLMPNDDFPYEEGSLRWITLRDPDRRQSGGQPLVGIPHGVDATGGYVVEFWPRYDEATSIRIPYYKRVDDISGSTIPIIRSDVIEALAAAYACTHLYAKFGDTHWTQQEERWEERYRARLDAALREDYDRHNLPRSVQGEHPVVGDHDWHITRDV